MNILLNDGKLIIQLFNLFIFLNNNIKVLIIDRFSTVFNY